MPCLRQLTVLSIALASLLACQENEQYTGMRTAEEQQLYQRVNDSMQHKTPDALTMITRQMDQAEDSLTWYDYYLLYGRHYLLSGNPDSVLPYVDKTLQFVASLQEQTPRTRGLAAIATSSKASYYYLLHQQPDTVINLYRQAYELMMQSDQKNRLPDLSANIGDAYVAIGDLAGGSKWYRRALYLNDSLRLPQQQTLTLYMGLGRIYTTLHDFEQAADFYEMADRRFDEMNPNIQSYFLNNYGNYFYYRRQYEKALETFRRMKKHIEHYNNEQTFDMFLCKINMADVFLNMNQTDSARIYVAEAEEYFRENRVDVGIYYAQTIRIGIALKEKRYADIEHILQESQDFSVSDPDMLSIRNEYLNKYYAAIGDYHHAYTSLKQGVETGDSAIMKRRYFRSSDILMRLTEDTIRLHNQLAMKQHEITYERTRSAFWMVLGLCIIVILAFVIWYYRERKRRLQSHLDILTLRMNNARQRISPHFVFNVLNSRINKSDDNEADQLMELARLIRANLDITSQPYVTLADELDFVCRYVDIERQMMGEAFEFETIVPEEDTLQHIKIPSMLVQILAENAILHGLKNSQEAVKRLCIKVECNDEATRIMVCDNGPGFDIRQYNSERSRTGLNIIRATISAINQENPSAKMHFDIHNENGCHATLTIPTNIHYPTYESINH